MYKSEEAAIQALMRFRVDKEERSGSNKEWTNLVKKAMKLLVRRFSTTPAYISELESILQSKELQSKCITVPFRALDPPITPLTYLQIWRWPGVRTNELLGEPHCKYKLSRVFNANANVNDEVCINPYHYKLASIEQPAMKVFAPIGDGSAMNITPHERSAGLGQLELNGALTAALETYSITAPINVELARIPELSNVNLNTKSSSNVHSFHISSNSHSASIITSNPVAYPVPPYPGNHAANSGSFSAATHQHVAIANTSCSATRYTSGSPQSAYCQMTRMESCTPVQSPTSTAAYYSMSSDPAHMIAPGPVPANCAPPRAAIDNSMVVDTGTQRTESAFNSLPAFGAYSKSPRPTATISYAANPAQVAEYGTAVSRYTSAHASPNGLFATQPASMTAGNGNQPEASQNGTVTYGEVVYVEPTCWCSVQYYEYLCRLGETFHCCPPILTVDGFCDPNSPECFCLGRISNPNREPEVEHVRRQIQRGVKLYYVAGEVYLENLSENAVFVQSSNMNMRNNWPLCAVCKVGVGMTAQLFSNRDFAALLAHNVNEGYESVFKLTYMCVIRMSFVKGWGAKYRRQTLSSVPCWVEIRLNGALQWLDRVLRQMGSPGLQTSTGSIK